MNTNLYKSFLSRYDKTAHYEFRMFLHARILFYKNDYIKFIQLSVDDLMPFRKSLLKVMSNCDMTINQFEMFSYTFKLFNRHYGLFIHLLANKNYQLIRYILSAGFQLSDFKSYMKYNPEDINLSKVDDITKKLLLFAFNNEKTFIRNLQTIKKRKCVDEDYNNETDSDDEDVTICKIAKHHETKNDDLIIKLLNVYNNDDYDFFMMLVNTNNYIFIKNAFRFFNNINKYYSYEQKKIINYLLNTYPICKFYWHNKINQ